MEKIMITLKDGTKADVDKEAFEELKNAMKEQNSKKIVLASAKCLMSSDKMMDDLVKNITKGIENQIGINR
jgi:RNase H-fold protein (predicted Holliday junction resolvase)